ncbi:MAG: YHS domain-containing (seleno)protein [Xenococcaceae cyanobacterium]
MKIKNLAVVAGAIILSLGMIAGCADTKTNTTNSNQVTTTQTDAANSNASKSTQVRVYTENDIAIKGTDPVAYFRESKPVQGSDQFTYQWMNATWKFASAENRDLFASNPEKYAPQYGGFCAWAVSQGYTAPIDPNAWKIVNGKLYLNFNKSVQRTWEKDIPGNIAKADQNWPGVLNN